MNKPFYTNVDVIGNTIYCREIDSENNANQYKTQYEPTLYIPCSSESPFKDIYGKNLIAKSFDNVWEAKQYVKQNEKLFDIYGSTKFSAPFIQENYPNIKSDVRFDQISIAVTDIEVFSPDIFPHPDQAIWPVNAITTYSNITKKYYTFHLLDEDTENVKWDKNLAIKNNELSEETADSVVYSFYNSEADLLKAWIKFFEALSPNIHSGWNSTTFDTPYLVNRINIVLSNAWCVRLSPWRKVLPSSKKNAFGGEDKSYDLLGVQDLDYLTVFKDKTFENQEKYTLDHIAHVVLGENKLTYEASEGLHGLYKADPQRFISYNIKDVELILRMDQKLNLFQLTQSVAYYAGINYTDTYSPIRTWESTIFNYLVPNGIIPPVKSSAKKEPYPGGYVKVPQTGLFKRVATFDLTSLYPMIIQQWNISPDTIESFPDEQDISQLIVDDGNIDFDIPGYCLAANNISFKTDKQGFMSTMMELLFSDRYAAKQAMFKAQHSITALEDELAKRGVA